MIVVFDTNKKKLQLAITIQTAGEVMMEIIAWDNSRPYTTYTKRVGTVNGVRTFKIRMPKSPEKTFVSISNKENGEQGDLYKVNDGKLVPVNNVAPDPSFIVTRVKEENLFQDRSRYNYNVPIIRSAVKFFEKFSERAGYLAAGGSVYTSEDGKIVIRYLDVIRDTNKFIDNEHGKKVRNPNFLQIVPTPARIGWDSLIIEVSKADFLGYTIGERMVILLHEFAHGYLNKEKANEIEADVNALKIYLPEGYPRIEAFKAFLTVFAGSPTEQNEERSVVIDDMISDYEDHEEKRAA